MLDLKPFDAWDSLDCFPTSSAQWVLSQAEGNTATLVRVHDILPQAPISSRSGRRIGVSTFMRPAVISASPMGPEMKIEVTAEKPLKKRS